VEPTAAKPGLRGRSFWALMTAQFLGAANDNAFRFVVTFLVLTTVPGDAPQKVPYVAAVGAVFVAPFLLFSSWAGWLADRFSKRTVLVYAKAAEIGAMALAVAALWSGSIGACLAILFLMAAQSAFFSPTLNAAAGRNIVPGGDETVETSPSGVR
jgi:acyl-[acyl-carrier-protein]-phospholipid O-acyltransferase/long-chain-fatty-acid--[acyl-carrier-protein] ligase